MNIKTRLDKITLFFYTKIFNKLVFCQNITHNMCLSSDIHAALNTVYAKRALLIHSIRYWIILQTHATIRSPDY